MISMFVVYLAFQASTIASVATVFSVVFGIMITIFHVVNGIIKYLENGTVMRNGYLPKFIYILFFFFVSLSVLIPNTNTVVAMLVLPSLSEDIGDIYQDCKGPVGEYLKVLIENQTDALRKDLVNPKG